jgi:peptide/nickel transport system permease protein
MFAYIMRRLGAAAVILFGSSYLLYNLAAFSGDPLEALRTSSEPNAKHQMLVLTRELQLNISPPVRYFFWLRGILGVFVGHMDFGKARNGHPVTENLINAIPTTIRLVTSATILAMIVGIAIGIITALRQYTRFDYAITFVSFLLLSLPIFWVAVLLKEFLAIRFNTFLAHPTIPSSSLAFFGIVSGVFWAALISGSRKKVLLIFIGVGTASVALLEIISAIGWLSHPGLGPIFVFLLGLGVACGITQISVGISNRAALKSSGLTAVLGLIFYYPAQYAFNHFPGVGTILILAAMTIALSVGSGMIFSKIDRGPIIRTSVITGFIIGLIILVDKLMQTWAPYMNTDAVNGRPVPTVGQSNTLLEPGHFWFTTLDSVMHLILPTIALTTISFAGYVRYTRGTLLEVLNSDYVRTARAKGLTERTVIMRHAFRNTLIPLTTIIVVDFAGIIGGAIITESVFGWVGMGTLFRQAISTFDLNLLMAVFFITGSLTVLANLVADLLYSALDPRIRVGAGKK